MRILFVFVFLSSVAFGQPIRAENVALQIDEKSNTFKWRNLNSTNCKKIEFRIYSKDDSVVYVIAGNEIDRGRFFFKSKKELQARELNVKMRIHYNDGYKGVNQIIKKGYYFRCY